MLIQIDTREKPEAIKGIIKAFNSAGVDHIRSKLYVGDYMSYDNPRTVIDRKKSMRELATNCTSERKRVEAELQRAKQHNIKVIFLVEEPMNNYASIMHWTPKDGQGTVTGYTIYRVISAWMYHYGCEFVFCRRSETGRKIIELLGGEDG